MGMKEEIFSIATALGYDGPTPTSKTKAVHAVAEVAGSGGGGGDTGYDVTITKVQAFQEQTVTFVESSRAEYIAEIDVTDAADFAQLFADAKTDFVFVLDGVEQPATLSYMSGYSIGTNDGNYSISIETSGGVVTKATLTDYSDGAAAGTRTLSVYHNDVEATITEEFGIAVNKTVYDKDFTVTLGRNGPGPFVADRSLDDINAAYDSGITPAYRLSLPNGTIDGSTSSSQICFVKTSFTGTDFVIDGMMVNIDYSANRIVGFTMGTHLHKTITTTD